ncbi:hypothetical protein FG93_05505 [Bosea sp. LC85]|nr:hypothetical protein FG93_05505 [Bosea sp. LC85]
MLALAEQQALLRRELLSKIDLNRFEAPFDRPKMPHEWIAECCVISIRCMVIFWIFSALNMLREAHCGVHDAVGKVSNLVADLRKPVAFVALAKICQNFQVWLNGLHELRHVRPVQSPALIEAAAVYAKTDPAFYLLSAGFQIIAKVRGLTDLIQAQIEFVYRSESCLSPRDVDLRSQAKQGRRRDDSRQERRRERLVTVEPELGAAVRFLDLGPNVAPCRARICCGEPEMAHRNDSENRRDRADHLSAGLFHPRTLPQRQFPRKSPSAGVHNLARAA